MNSGSKKMRKSDNGDVDSSEFDCLYGTEFFQTKKKIKSKQDIWSSCLFKSTLEAVTNGAGAENEANINSSSSSDSSNSGENNSNAQTDKEKREYLRQFEKEFNACATDLLANCSEDKEVEDFFKISPAQDFFQGNDTTEFLMNFGSDDVVTTTTTTVSKPEDDENFYEADSFKSLSFNSISTNYSFDDSVQFTDTNNGMPSFDELPIFSIESASPLSSINDDAISLLNLSVSPISSNYELAEDTHNEFSMDFGAYGGGFDRTADSDGDDDRITLDEIHAKINTPPSAKSSKNLSKRLNLETIYEGVFLETPPKKRSKPGGGAYGGNDSWRKSESNYFKDFSVERTNSYVLEQRHTIEYSNDVTKKLCDIFDDQINIIG